MPLRHIAFLEITDTKSADIIHQELKKLSEKLNCLDFQFARCASNNGMNYCFFMDFKDEAARDNYLVHPDHVSIATNFIIPKLKKGLDSAVVFDVNAQGQKKACYMKKGRLGFVLVEGGQEEEVLNALSKFCDKINKLKPLQNCSNEELGKKYPYALWIESKQAFFPAGNKALKIVYPQAEGALQKKDEKAVPKALLPTAPQLTSSL